MGFLWNNFMIKHINPFVRKSVRMNQAIKEKQKIFKRPPNIFTS